MTIIMNGIIDAIKELRNQTNCPFCNKQLEFLQADSYGQDNRFTLQCRECKLEFTLTHETHKKETKWVLNGVRKTYSVKEELWK